MLERPPAPSAPRRYLHQHAFPVLIDAAGALEAGLERAAVATRAEPVRMLALAAATGWLVSRLTDRLLSRRGGT
jgi:hypothetical protein